MKKPEEQTPICMVLFVVLYGGGGQKGGGSALREGQGPRAKARPTGSVGPDTGAGGTSLSSWWWRLDQQAQTAVTKQPRVVIFCIQSPSINLSSKHMPNPKTFKFVANSACYLAGGGDGGDGLFSMKHVKKHWFSNKRALPTAIGICAAPRMWHIKTGEEGQHQHSWSASLDNRL